MRYAPAFASLLLAVPALAQSPAPEDVPSVATVITASDVQLTVGELRLEILLTPAQVERLSAALGEGSTPAQGGEVTMEMKPAEDASGD